MMFDTYYLYVAIPIIVSYGTVIWFFKTFRSQNQSINVLLGLGGYGVFFITALLTEGAAARIFVQDSGARFGEMGSAPGLLIAFASSFLVYPILLRSFLKDPPKPIRRSSGKKK